MNIGDVTILSNEEWGAQKPHGEIYEATPTKIILHHMYTPNPPNHISKADPKVLAKECQKWHFDRGWADTGQNFTISCNGTILEGRHGSIAALNNGKCVSGAHCIGQNYNWGIELEGDHRSEYITPQQEESLIILCKLLCSKCKIDSSHIYGHSDFNDTNCPGTSILRKISEIQQKVHNAILSIPV